LWSVTPKRPTVCWSEPMVRTHEVQGAKGSKGAIFMLAYALEIATLF